MRFNIFKKIIREQVARKNDCPRIWTGDWYLGGKTKKILSNYQSMCRNKKGKNQQQKLRLADKKNVYYRHEKLLN